MKIIIIPVDFSKESEKALRVGATIAKGISAKLLLTHMIALDEDCKDLEFADAIEKKRYYAKLGAKQFDAFLNKDFLKGVLVEPLVQNHFDFESFSLFADEISADLIVMGTAGSSRFVEVEDGSNAQIVIRNSKVPVLVVKENNLHFTSEKILFVSDFNIESVTAYHSIANIATQLNATLEFLYINLPGPSFKSTREMDERLYSFFKDAQHSNPVEMIKKVNRYADYSIEEGIYNFSQLIATDIIAIPTHGRKGLSHILKGSISEDVANHAILPVLTVKI